MVVAKKNNKKTLEFPLIDQAESAENNIFSDTWEIPSYISNNLKHNLRPYQEQAISNYNYTQTNINPSPNHVLFKMATGSGKTDLMAGLILYLYKCRGYYNFLFTVNTESIISKTINNLIDNENSKYLYSEKIEMDGKNIYIKKVDRFPKIQEDNTIYIKFETVQGISNDLFTLEENKMSLIDYQNNPVAILADEAHHYSVNTKSEKEEENTWEEAISKILNARNGERKENLLLEFTATMDFENAEIYNKYKDKVVYRYPLSKFMYDGYSKKVKRIETSANDEEKMLNVVLLSQFRKYKALESNVTSSFKPVILFKSSKIDVSKKANKDFNKIIDDLNVKNLLSFIKRQRLMDDNENAVLELAYKYYMDNLDNLDKIVEDIKIDFDERNIINANDSLKKNMLETGKYQALNTLEDPNNFYRVVFAVAKLTEGWDVLNLYDIVRISEGADNSSKGVYVEGQLIGRGARYYPFAINGSKSFKRRFDNDNSNKQLILETLHYHTMNNPKYLKKLREALEEMDLPTEKDKKNPPVSIKVKSSFKKTEVYKKGKIYYNQTVDVPDEYFDSIQKYGINHTNDIQLNLNYGSQEVDYSSQSKKIETKVINISKFNERYVKKAINKLDFYKFSNLKKYVPKINSMREFIYGKKWLNAKELKLFLTVPINFDENDFKPDELLNIIIKLLKEYELKIKNGFIKKRGTNKFIGYPIREYINDYKKRVPEYDIQTQFDRNQDIKVYGMEDNPFYVYDNAIVNKLEYELIEKIKSYITDLKEKYGKAVYLFRMDENMHKDSERNEKLKLHQFETDDDTEIHLEGFQPDFILFLENTNDYYFQIFIEPKGMSGDRYVKELWKEKLLTYITNNNGSIEFENNDDNVRIYGLKFYTKNDGQHTIKQLLNLTGINSNK